MQRQLQAVASRKARSTKYATVLKDLVMRSSQMRPVEKMTLLFGELSERCAQAVDEARQKAELDREGSAESPSPLNEGDEKGKWQDTHSQLLELVQDEMRLAAEQNASLAASYNLERTRREECETTMKTLSSPPPTADGVATSSSEETQLPQPGDTTDATAAAASDAGAPAAEGAAAAAAVPLVYTAPAATSDSAATAEAAETTAAASSSEVVAPLASLSPSPSPPPPPAIGACIGKRCPTGYEMVDRGDRCTCRPRATAT